MHATNSRAAARSILRSLFGALWLPAVALGARFVDVASSMRTFFFIFKSEAFGVTEFVLPVPQGYTEKNSAKMIFSKGRPASIGEEEGKFLRFRFSPRDAKVWSYKIESDSSGLDGQSGKFDAVPPPLERTSKQSTKHPNWWIDDPDPAAAVGVHPGAKSVSQWREDYLRDFAERMDRCKPN